MPNTPLFTSVELVSFDSFLDTFTAPPQSSQSQKRANHINAEKKRRETIKRKAEDLCTVIPSLSDLALVQEQEQGKGRSKARDRLRFKMGGPKSEKVILTKTIDHLRSLQSTRTALLHRLAHLRQVASARGLREEAHRTSEVDWERPWAGTKSTNEPGEEDEEPSD